MSIHRTTTDRRTRLINGMNVLACLVLVSVTGVLGQENAARNVPSSLLECYNTTYMVEKDNRLPHNVNTLIAVLRKIENTAGLNMDLRALSVALLHRFRQDGITLNPSVQVQDGVVPYAPNGLSFSRCAATLRLVPGNAVSFPNDSLTAVERCSLHYMVSSSVEPYERGDEGTICNKLSAQYRIPRDISGTIEESVTDSESSVGDDVETLTPEQLEIMRRKNVAHESQGRASTVDPNWMYPDLPPNHPDSARVYAAFSQSACPVENGVVMTKWGAVSAGPVLAGIAAALQPQTVSLVDLLSADLEEKGYTSGAALDNKWIATLAGDLAEAALVQGPVQGEAISIGVTGGWNSSALPRWYFLSSNENVEMTTAEIRGDLDGLILAENVATWYAADSTLRLSQILDMYYDARGVFNSSIRACNRRTMVTSVAPNATTVGQAYSAALVLHEDVARVTISAERIESFSNYATKMLFDYIPASMNNDLECTATDAANDFNRASVHLTIILDTTWPFTTIQPYIATLLEEAEVGMYNSNFTVMNAYDGSVMINSSNTILDFYSFNSTNYTSFTSGFDLPRAIDSLRTLQTQRLDAERTRGAGGASSDIVLVLTYTSTISETDKTYCLEQFRVMSEEVPDVTVLFLTYGSKDRWTSLATDSTTDTFAISYNSDGDTLTSINPVVSRMKQVPKRLLNSACGASFSASGSTASFVDYVEPSGINYYRLHPNYFFGDSTGTPTVKIQGTTWGTLGVCWSRSVQRPNATTQSDVSCTTVTTNTQSITLSCDGAYLIRECQPLFVSVAANGTTTSTSTTFGCTDPSVCRFPDMLKYTISYENLVCRSHASERLFVGTFLLITSVVLNFVQ